MSHPSPLFARVAQAVSPRFRLVREVASGGMGVVYEAEDLELRRRTAIKVPRPELFTAAFAARFVSEARALAAVRHPNVITIFDARATDGLSLLFMEFVAGPTLQQRLAGGPLPAATVRSIAVQLASALHAVHARGIVHCDVKPANIVLEDDHALLSDFGIAALADTTEVTAVREAPRAGTPAYMSPEQRAYERPGPASDIYSLGLVLREALTGLGPHEWRELPAGAAQQLPSDPELSPLISAMLATDPAARPTARAMLRALDRPGTGSRLRRAVAIALGALAAVLLLSAAAVLGPEFVGRLGGVPQPLADIAIGAIEAGGDSALASRVPQLIEKNLEWFAPLRLARPPATDRSTARARRVASGSVALQGTLVSAELAVRDQDGRLVEMVSASGSASAIQEFACALTDSLMRKVFRPRYVEYSSFDQCRVSDVQAANSYFKGIEDFRTGDWAAAEQHFNAALERDPGMLEAAWELMITQRFQRKDEVPILRRLLAGRDSLPPFYGALVEAQLTPELHLRFDRYQQVVRHYQRTSKALLLYTNEAFHRGPLIGRRLAQAVDTMRKLALVDPDMDHTSVYDISIWGSIRLGDQDAAWEDYSRRKRLSGPGDRYAPFQRLAIWARFNPGWAHLVQRWAFRDPDAATMVSLTELTRLGTWFDIPAMQDDLGGVLVRHGTDLTQRSAGVLAQATSRIMQGRVSEGLALLDTAAVMLASAELRLQQHEWPVLLAALGLPVPPGRVEEGRAALRGEQRDPDLAARASWALGLLALSTSDTAEATHRLRELEALASRAMVAARLAPLLAAHVIDNPRASLDTTAGIFLLDSVATRLSPFARAVTYLGRARWQRALDDPDAADRELLWYENADQVGWPIGAPQQGEVDAVLSPYARLLRGEIALERHDPAACRLLQRVRELWHDAEPAMQPLVARAALARARCR